MKKIFLGLALMIVILAFSSCSGGSSAEDEYTAEESVEEEYTEAEHNDYVTSDFEQEPLYEPEQEQPYIPESEIVTENDTVIWPSHSRRLIPITGIITNFYGPISEDGTVPWDIEWFEIEIIKDDGSPAIIIGMHGTGFFFGGKPVPGMEIVAYIAYDSPVFINNPPLYIATAIVAGMPSGLGVAICCAISDRICSFSFIITNETEVAHTDFMHSQTIDWRYQWLDTSDDGRSMAQWFVTDGLRWDFGDSPVAVMYGYAYDGLPVAKRLIVLNSDIPNTRWAQEPDQPIALTFTRYIFPAGAFETIDLPILVNSEEIKAPQPILATDGSTVLVPFREIFAAGIGFGNYAFVQNDGRLMFGGGGGGSENSHWEIGRATVHGIGWGVPICTPPIIVGGIIYIPLISGIGNAAPFANAWLFEDRIEIFGSNAFPYGPWIGFTSWDEDIMIDDDLAKLPIVINGVEIDSSHAIFRVTPYNVHRNVIMVPLQPIVEALGYSITQEDDETFLLTNVLGEKVEFWQFYMIDSEIYMYLRWLFPLASGIIYNGQILIESR